MKVGLGEPFVGSSSYMLVSYKVLVAPQKELNLLMEALNGIEIDHGFDCNDDGVGYH